MKLDLRILVVALCSGAGVVSASASSVDPVMWLSQARAAIGGDVAAETVTSLRIRGSKYRHVGRVLDMSWEAFWEAPDKFVQVETQTETMGPMGTISTTRRNGFYGSDEILETISEFPSPPRPQAKPNAGVPRQRRLLTQLLLPLLASAQPLASVAPLSIVVDPSVPSRPGQNLVTFATPDGVQLHLFLDATTHLPSALSWMDFPVVMSSTTMTTMTVTTTERVPAGQGPPRIMPMPPAGLPPPPPAVTRSGPPTQEPWEMTLTNYRTDKGLNLPRRITVTLGTKVWEEMRISRYEINPKINARTFRVRK